MKKMTGKPLIVTGLSGAGMSSVLKALEDFGFEVFDNFPLSLVLPLCEETAELEKTQGWVAPIAIGIDTRTRGFSAQAVLNAVSGIGALFLFVTCDDHVLHRRFTETRRRHPLARNRPVSYGIKKEHELLDSLRQNADIVLDTTDISIHDLRHILEGHFEVRAGQNLSVTLMSFGFRGGIPREADIVMDVRFLKNPHWVADLRAQTGLQEEVGAYISSDPDFDGFLERFEALLKPLLPRYGQEGKSYLTVAIGCTGGKHRSVYTVERLAEWFREKGIAVYIEHRDLQRKV